MIPAGNPDVAHVSGHSFALFNASAAATTAAATDGAGRTVLALGTVRVRHTTEMVAFHHAGKPLALGQTNNVNLFDLAKRVGGQNISGIDLGLLGSPDLTNKLHRLGAGLGGMSDGR